MHDEVLPGKTQTVLALIGEKKVLPENTYLAGGTACALHLGHRISFDLDYYTSEEFSIELQLKKLNDLNHNFNKSFSEDLTILGEFPEIKFSLFYYSYPLIDDSTQYLDNTIVGLKDIATMKINAISDRGAKRDFVDLYFIMTRLNFRLDLILDLYDEKFNSLASNKAHILKSLVFFDDADQNIDPKMLVDWDWTKIKTYFTKQVKDFEKNNLQ